MRAPWHRCSPNTFADVTDIPGIILARSPRWCCRNWDRYHYPEDYAGFSVITLDAVAYGKGRSSALFVLGKGLDNGEWMKFRYYPKRDYVGYHLPSSQYAWEGARWLILYTTLKDGAIEIAGALPLPESAVMPLVGKSQEKPSLDAVIAAANAKR